METGSPCFRCGVRPDIECRHRPADPDWTPPAAAPARRPDKAAGLPRGAYAAQNASDAKGDRIRARLDILRGGQ